jgi:predicted amidohydrolase YtcJ
MLIHDAEMEGGARHDIRIEAGRVIEIGNLAPRDNEPTLDARGALLLPGLHDHHIHVAALAAARNSVPCGPPNVSTIDELRTALGRRGAGWLRGVGYHESVAGLLDAATIDRIQPDRPIRIQHRGGRMWFLNSAGIDKLLAAHVPPPGLEKVNGRFTGRLFDEDGWLKSALGGQPPDFKEVGAMLARVGVTGVTEISPANDAVIAQHFSNQRASGHLPQTVLLAGKPCLCEADMAGLILGPVKLHLHEESLPDFDEFVAAMRDAHRQGRSVAVHCATEVELVFTLAAFDAAGPEYGDRIEHASVAPDTAVAEIARLGLAVVSQPHFIAERGDAYRSHVAAADQSYLYRLRAFLDAGVTLAGGSDAPFGGTNPWASMTAAVSRATPSGAQIGSSEALTPEQALDLYLRAPAALDRRRVIETGMTADLCLLDRNWQQARGDLASVAVRATWIDGRLIHNGVDQSPI